MSISPVASAAPMAAATQPVKDGQWLQSVYTPTASPAGGVFKIVEKDTGRVILELPFEAPSSAAGDDAHAVDITA